MNKKNGGEKDELKIKESWKKTGICESKRGYGGRGERGRGESCLKERGSFDKWMFNKSLVYTFSWHFIKYFISSTRCTRCILLTANQRRKLKFSCWSYKTGIRNLRNFSFRNSTFANIWYFDLFLFLEFIVVEKVIELFCRWVLTLKSQLFKKNDKLHAIDNRVLHFLSFLSYGSIYN